MERIQLEALNETLLARKCVFCAAKALLRPTYTTWAGISSPEGRYRKLKQTLARAGKNRPYISCYCRWWRTGHGAHPRLQKHPLTQDLLHVDFYQVKMTEKIKADIPLVFVGDAPASR